jgi:hypothetical protein
MSSEEKEETLSLEPLLASAAEFAVLPAALHPQLDPMHAGDPRLMSAPPLLAARSPPETRDAQLSAESNLYLRADADALLTNLAIGMPLDKVAATLTPATRDLVIQDLERRVAERIAAGGAQGAASQASQGTGMASQGSVSTPAAPAAPAPAPAAPAISALSRDLDAARAKAEDASFHVEFGVAAGMAAAVLGLVLVFFYLLRQPTRKVPVMAALVLIILVLPAAALALRVPLLRVLLPAEDQVEKQQEQDATAAAPPAPPAPRIYPLLKRSAAEAPFAGVAEREAEAEQGEPGVEVIIAAVVGQAETLEEAIAQARNHNTLARRAIAASGDLLRSVPGKGISPLSEAMPAQEGVLYPLIRAVHFRKAERAWGGYAEVPEAQAMAAQMASADATGALPSTQDLAAPAAPASLDFEREWRDPSSRALSYHLPARSEMASSLREGLALLEGLRGAYAGARSAANASEVALAIAARNIVSADQARLDAYDAYFSPDPALFASPAAAPAELRRMLVPPGMFTATPLSPAYPAPGSTAAEVTAQMRSALNVAQGEPLALAVQLAAISGAAQNNPAVAPALAASDDPADPAPAPGEFHPSSWLSRSRLWMSKLFFMGDDVQGDDPTDVNSLREVAAVLPEEATPVPLADSSVSITTPLGTHLLPFWTFLAAAYAVVPAAFALGGITHLLITRLRGAKIAPEAAAAPTTTATTPATPTRP